MDGPSVESQSPTAPRLVVFDLLSALLDSEPVWERAAGSREAGRRWRARVSQAMIAAGRYEDYPALVERARQALGIGPDGLDRLLEGWSTVVAWPEVETALAALPVPFAVLTNCSAALARSAVARLPRAPVAVIAAESIGFYKPDPQAYRAALERCGAPREEVLYVAGSAFDMRGAASFGLVTRWVDRRGEGEPAPGVLRYVTLADLSRELDRYPAR